VKLKGWFMPNFVKEEFTLKSTWCFFPVVVFEAYFSTWQWLVSPLDIPSLALHLTWLLLSTFRLVPVCSGNFALL
jgi:hypothetical protein